MTAPTAPTARPRAATRRDPTPPPTPADPAGTPKVVRCAIYTRKSTDEGLEREFNTLDAQRDAGEAYVRALKHEGWVALPDRYDDGGCTGANLDRPALARLVRDIEAGRIDCVVVYKVDRLSRSLLDFARLMHSFEARGTAFVSVTQQFHTGSSMGRLVLNVLLSFAQFERELIAERTRDKVAAARRKGHWTGGRPVLGYAIEAGPRQNRLVVVPDEASRVRDIYALYLALGSLLPLTQELARRGWVNKAHAVPEGKTRPGKPFTRTSLHQLLTNVLYAGKVRYKDEVHPGQHEAIVDAGVWQQVQDHLARGTGHGRGVPPPGVRNRSGALLRGLLHCVACGAAMTPTHATKGSRRYRYYACVSAQKKGHATCPRPTLAAEPVERLVVQQVAAVGRDPALQDQVLATLAADALGRRDAHARDARLLRAEVRARTEESRRLAASLAPGGDNAAALAALTRLQAELDDRQRRLTELIAAPPEPGMPPDAARQALCDFAPVWEALTLNERERLVREVVARVDRHADGGRVTVTLHPTASSGGSGNTSSSGTSSSTAASGSTYGGASSGGTSAASSGSGGSATSGSGTPTASSGGVGSGSGASSGTASSGGTSGSGTAYGSGGTSTAGSGSGATSGSGGASAPPAGAEETLAFRYERASSDGTAFRYLRTAAGAEATATDALGRDTAFAYDAAGNLLSLTDALGHATVWAYDAQGRKLSEASALGTRTFAYDALGRLAGSADRDGRARAFSYDAAGRLTSEAWLAPAGGAAWTIAYAYDAAGRLASASDAQSQVSYTYDAAGLLDVVTTAGTAVGGTIVIDYDADAAGNVAAAAVSVNGVIDHVEGYEYDAAGRLTRVTQRGAAGGSAVSEKRVDYAYDAAGRTATVTRYADLAGTELVAVSTYAYSGRGRLEALSHAQGATVLAAFSWTHTAAGRVASATTAGAGTASYSYDAAGQLTGATSAAGGAGGDASYAYDAGGNRVGAGYATAAGGEQSAGAGWAYEYDAEGNRTRKVDAATGASADYRWDPRGRLVGADTRDAAGHVTSSVAFAYDALNQRIAKVARDGAGNVVSEEHYVLAARDLSAPGVSGGVGSQAGLEDLSLVLGAGGAVVERYAYGARVDEVLAVEAAGGGTRWLLADDLGSVRAEVAYDSAAGHAAVVRVVAYDAFGGVASDTSPGLKSRFGYTGREVDTETGLQFNRARYYDALTGRWVSRDPKGFAAGDANLYRYVGNSATNATDPTGLEDPTKFDPDRITEYQFNTLFMFMNGFNSRPDYLVRKVHPGQVGKLFIEGILPTNSNASVTPAQHALGMHEVMGNGSPYTSASTLPEGARKFEGKRIYIDRSKLLGFATVVETPEIRKGVQDGLKSGEFSTGQADPWLKNNPLKLNDSHLSSTNLEMEALIKGPVPPKALDTKATLLLKRAGRGLTVIAAAQTAYELEQAAERSVKQDSARPIAAETVRQIGGWGGAIAGAKIGFVVAGAAGLGTGPGAILTGFGGAIIFGGLGYFSASQLADTFDEK